MSLQHKTITDHLRERLARIGFDRAGLKNFTDLPVMSHGFFPGGNGLYEGKAATRFPVGGTLVLGSNFDTYANFVNAEGVLVIPDERSKTTWTRLLRLLEESGIDKHESFFTNAWPCLHEGESAVVTKLIPFWLEDDQLMRECLEFFNDTYVAMRPRLIVALGPGPAAFLGHVWSSTLGAWKGQHHHLSKPSAWSLGAFGSAHAAANRGWQHRSSPSKAGNTGLADLAPDERLTLTKKDAHTGRLTR